MPDQIDAIIAKKHEDLDDRDVVRLYSLVSTAPGWSPDDPRVVETADILDRIQARAADTGDLGDDVLDEQVVALLDAAVVASSPAARRLLTLLEERGWKGFTRLERIP